MYTMLAKCFRLWMLPVFTRQARLFRSEVNAETNLLAGPRLTLESLPGLGKEC